MNFIFSWHFANGVKGVRKSFFRKMMSQAANVASAGALWSCKGAIFPAWSCKWESFVEWSCECLIFSAD